MDALAKAYTLKEGSVKEPELYLGATVTKWYIKGADDPAKASWAISAEGYIKLLLKDVEGYLEGVG